VLSISTDLPFIAYILYARLSSVDKMFRNVCLHVARLIRTWSRQIFAQRGYYDEVDTEEDVIHLPSQKLRVDVRKTELRNGKSRRHNRRSATCKSLSQVTRKPSEWPALTHIATHQLHALCRWSVDTKATLARTRVQTAGGFKLIPPESKVMPLPTKAMG
jgi:hypothetical protein